MKSTLVEDLIIAHCSGNEQQFSDALYKLADDEARKGNIATSSRLRKSYETNKPTTQKKDEGAFYNSSFTASACSTISPPRDKDSLLELYDIVYPDISLDNVVLPDSQMQALHRFINEQKHVENLMQHNIPPANRILLCGPPGCGKTMTANAISNALHLPMAYVRLDGLVSSYLGQTSTNLRKVFDAVRTQRIVLFLDEFDAIAKKRDDANELGELKRVVTTLLQNFDNLPANVILLAATNHEHLLDPAIWRRFNFTIMLDLPSLQHRQQIIQHCLKKYSINSNIRTTTLAKITDGMNGARIDELMCDAAKKYLLDGKLTTSDIISLLIQQKTHFSGNHADFIKEICDILDKGVSIRTAASALGVSHSTLQYQVQKYRRSES